VNERWAGAVPDTFWLLEHPPVITLGRGSRSEHVLADGAALSAAGAEVWETTRGGDVTYHGPGQLVCYGIVDLRERGRDVGRYLRDLEAVLLAVLADFGLEGRRHPGLTGAWLGERKVAAIGVRAERWITSHGFALNVSPDLGHFGWIVPCGIRDYGVTSIAAECAARGMVAPDMAGVARATRRRLADVFEIELQEVESPPVSELGDEAAPLGGVHRVFPPEPATNVASASVSGNPAGVADRAAPAEIARGRR
jgi:lipoyl(octanoyl) transferase